MDLLNHVLNDIRKDRTYCLEEEEDSEMLYELSEDLLVLNKFKREFTDCNTASEEVNIILQDQVGLPIAQADNSVNNSNERMNFRTDSNLIDFNKQLKERNTESYHPFMLHCNIIPVTENCAHISQIFNGDPDYSNTKYILPYTTTFKTLNNLSIEDTDSGSPKVHSERVKISLHDANLHDCKKEAHMIQVNTSSESSFREDKFTSLLEPSPKCIVITDVNIYVCDLCDEEFMEDGFYIQHLKDVHSMYSVDFTLRKKKISNVICSSKVISGPKITLMKKKNKQSGLSNEPDDSSTLPPRHFSSSRSTPVLGNIKESKFKCGIFGCSYKFSSTTKRKEHHACHDLRPYSTNSFLCFECSQEFPKWNSCSSHLWEKHGIDVDLLKCGICDCFRTTTIPRMSLHQQIHTETKPYICRVCDRAFKQLSQLLNHETTHKTLKQNTTSAWTQRTLCNLCSKWFSSYRSYLQHYQSAHLKLKKFSCPNCDYECCKKSRMTEHLRKHSQEKKYLCEICNYCCIDHNGIRRHRLQHLPSKHLVCPAQNCSLKTAYASVFRNHTRIKHQDVDLLYTCQICSFLCGKMEDYLSHSSRHERDMISELINKADGAATEKNTPS